MMKEVTNVSVGIVLNEDQKILMAWRDNNKSPGNCWEFPGGKIEQGETAYQALCRELFEEIGIQVKSAHTLPNLSHEYQSAIIVLHPFLIEEYFGIPIGAEGQFIMWASLSQISNFVLPSANYALVNLLLEFQNKFSSNFHSA